MGGIERPITDKAKSVAQTRLGGVPIVIRDAAGLLGYCHLLEQASMVACFDAQNIMHVVIVQHLDMRGVGAQAVFGDTTWKVMSQISDALKYFPFGIKGL